MLAAQPFDERNVEMASHARKDIVREGEVGCYHVWSRCVQRIWLCGVDPLTGKDYSHRKQWIENLLIYLERVFAVDVGAHHILSNHKHAVLCTRPDVAETWSQEEIVWRWKLAWPQWEAGQWYREPSDREIEEVLAKGPDHIEQLRKNLSSLSWFLGRWKEPIARRVNAEAGTSGHMWAERFGSRELTDDGELLVACVYTDLQQLKCGAVQSIEESANASIQLRLRAWAANESKEIVQAFERKKIGDEQYHLSPELIEEMLADSWLMPLSDDSPLLLMRQESTTEPAAAISETPTSVRPAKSSEGRTFEIHRQHRPKLDERAMRRQLLEMSRAQYLEIVQQAAQAWQVTNNEDPLIDRQHPPRMSDDGTLGGWQASFKQFRAFLFGLAAKQPLLRTSLARGDPG